MSETLFVSEEYHIFVLDIFRSNKNSLLLFKYAHFNVVNSVIYCLVNILLVILL